MNIFSYILSLFNDQVPILEQIEDTTKTMKIFNKTLDFQTFNLDINYDTDKYIYTVIQEEPYKVISVFENEHLIPRSLRADIKYKTIKMPLIKKIF